MESNETAVVKAMVLVPYTPINLSHKLPLFSVFTDVEFSEPFVFKDTKIYRENEVVEIKFPALVIAFNRP